MPLSGPAERIVCHQAVPSKKLQPPWMARFAPVRSNRPIHRYRWIGVVAGVTLDVEVKVLAFGTIDEVVVAVWVLVRSLNIDDILVLSIDDVLEADTEKNERENEDDSVGDLIALDRTR